MKKLFLILSVLVFSLSPAVAFAGDASPFAGGDQSKAGFNKFFGKAVQDQTVGSDLVKVGQGGLEASLPIAIGRIINTLLGFVGVILLIIYVMAGFMWLTAGGDNSKVESAKKYIRNATIGLVLAITVFALTSFIVTFLERAILATTS